MKTIHIFVVSFLFFMGSLQLNAMTEEVKELAENIKKLKLTDDEKDLLALLDGDIKAPEKFVHAVDAIFKQTDERANAYKRVTPEAVACYIASQKIPIPDQKDLFSLVFKNKNTFQETTKLFFATFKDTFGETALHYAARTNDMTICFILLGTYCADVNAKNNQKNTPLHIAAMKGHYKTCQTLVGEKADVNTLNNLGESPLFDPVRRRDEKTCEILIAARASVTIINNKQETVFDIDQDGPEKQPHEIRTLLEKNKPGVLGWALSFVW